MFKEISLTWKEVEKLEAHPYAEMFPLISGGDRERLRAGIRKRYNPLHPITLYQGKIVDGRGRREEALAAHRDGAMATPPTFQEYTGNDAGVLEWIKEENLDRRQLEPGQIAIAEAKYGAFTQKAQEEAKERQHRGRPKASEVMLNSAQVQKGPATVIAAKKLGISRWALEVGKKLVSEAPDLAEKVERGEIKMNAAEAELRERQGKKPYDRHVKRERKKKEVESWDNVCMRDGVVRKGSLLPTNPNGDNRMAVFTFSFTYNALAEAAALIKGYLTQKEMERFIDELRNQPVTPYPEFDYWGDH